MTIQQLIKEQLKAKGWSTYKLAKEADISLQTMYMIEKGTTKPNLTNLQKIADALGIEIGISGAGFREIP